MAGPRKGDTSKRAAGLAKKAEVAAQKAAVQAAKDEAAEEEKWKTGAKNSRKKEVEQEKKADLARKKAEREALLAAEEQSLPSRSTPKKSKTAVKKARGPDLSQFDDIASDHALPSLNASGIDNALDALTITTGTSNDTKIERHPERRYPAAYAKYEERRLAEMEADGTGAGLRLNQRKERIRKEFEKSPENPFNQVTARFDATKEELAQIKQQEKSKIEQRLGNKR
ncbi:hypothetical protein jhhlp_003646 [Lomentospora prolificans]|uniref:DUF1014 domain protein n=1 Tax=Lomentospora prolificans TaxID=41688 RepID=A0A2N3N9B1_9PEZI|nr:hypothetical protein jhhlp_003646 [Lomentospora prolificans]